MLEFWSTISAFCWDFVYIHCQILGQRSKTKSILKTVVKRVCICFVLRDIRVVKVKRYHLSESCLFWEMTCFLRELNFCFICHCVCLFLEECDLKIAYLLSTGVIKIKGVAVKKKMKEMYHIFLGEMYSGSRPDFLRQVNGSSFLLS